MTDSVSERRRRVVVAGHTGDHATARSHLDDADAGVRAAALGALERLGVLDDATVVGAFGDDRPEVRRRAAELAGRRPHLSLLALLLDADASVVETAAWGCGEQEAVDDDVLERLIEIATEHAGPLVREAAAAALGALGDRRGLPAILAACDDKPHVRRRAVLALAPFEGPDVDAALEGALEDRDWQVRQSAEDLRRAAGDIDLP